MNYFSIENNPSIEEIEFIYSSKKEKINLRLEEFSKVWAEGTDKEIFAELIFCILTPQASGKSCWAAVENMIRKDILYKGDLGRISKEIKGARFINKKAAYIIEAREKFLGNDETTSLRSIISKIKDGYRARDWLANNIKGIGYKEASHLLRNIGFERNLAILDRHILKNLHLVGALESIPNSISKRRYFDIEKKMLEFANAIQIPMSHLDFVMWYKETGEIFK
jgi:N-glycosylase/DNA lyase